MELPPDKRKLVMKQLHKLLAQNELDLYYKDAEAELFSLMPTCSSVEALKNALIDSDEFLYQHPSNQKPLIAKINQFWSEQSASSSSMSSLSSLTTHAMIIGEKSFYFLRKS